MTMFILAHRGFWRHPDEKNTPAALEAALQRGWGLETDLRDCGGRLVISHDPPDRTAPDFDGLLQAYCACQSRGWLALNLKADGLADRVARQLAEREIDRYFAFDMSVPDMVSCLKAGLRVLTRVSDYEPDPVLACHARGFWVDGFERDWSDWDFVRRELDAGKTVCLVSPELHGRDHHAFWQALARSGCLGYPNLGLCSDYPDEFVRLYGRDLS